MGQRLNEVSVKTAGICMNEMANCRLGHIKSLKEPQLGNPASINGPDPHMRYLDGLDLSSPLSGKVLYNTSVKEMGGMVFKLL